MAALRPLFTTVIAAAVLVMTTAEHLPPPTRDLLTQDPLADLHTKHDPIDINLHNPHPLPHPPVKFTPSIPHPFVKPHLNNVHHPPHHQAPNKNHIFPPHFNSFVFPSHLNEHNSIFSPIHSTHSKPTLPFNPHHPNPKPIFITSPTHGKPLPSTRPFKPHHGKPHPPVFPVKANANFITVATPQLHFSSPPHHLSAFSVHPMFPSTNDLGFDPYVYLRPYYPQPTPFFFEYGHDAGNNADEVLNELISPHVFPPHGYDLDSYFSDFPAFGYFNYEPSLTFEKVAHHHRRRRGVEV
ncbi:36.4 kDa proline-rich protein-like isoform X1 [Homarus americanus]|uniref:36.4 kDa proline-rich protein-like isoform X1 n=1 Tax=Homarus americanus TaxID=6706 RepID=UPI001C447620|nr:36.4 kDa proline-rich protein-like isoform X1 [Homarus americanus]